jgi:hypothetical protein
MPQLKAQLKQLTGPGCGIPELEHCPTMYHADFAANEFSELLKDPVGIMKQLGHHEQHITVVLGGPPANWTEPTTKAPMICCYARGDVVTCHVHD